MKKLLVYLFSLLLLIFSVFYGVAETVVLDWQGSEEGVESEPDWLSDFLEKKKDSRLRKFFDLRKDDLYFAGIVDDVSLDDAKAKAKSQVFAKASDSMKKELGLSKNDSIRVSALERRWEFWQEITDVKDKVLLQKINDWISGENESSESEADELEFDVKYRAFCIYTISGENWRNLKKMNRNSIQ